MTKLRYSLMFKVLPLLQSQDLSRYLSGAIGFFMWFYNPGYSILVKNHPLVRCCVYRELKES
jgi:hypothetical protein